MASSLSVFALDCPSVEAGGMPEYFEEYVKLLPDVVVVPDDKKMKAICSSLLNVPLTNEQFKQLTEDTDVSLLNCEDDPAQIKSYDVARKLFTVLYNKTPDETSKMSEHLSSLQADQHSTYKSRRTQFLARYFKYSTVQTLWTQPKTKYSRNWGTKYQHSTLIISIRVYRPTFSGGKDTRYMRLEDEIVVTNHNSLAELRDHIHCNMDYTGMEDVSNDIYTSPSLRLPPKEVYPSGFFFIENTFFNDTRTTKMKDLSQGVKEWAEKKQLGSFKTSSMASTLFKNLKFSFGKPYVYLHQGNCEHLLVFSDARTLDNNNIYKYSHYPKNICRGRSNAKLCVMCGILYAKWLVKDSNRLTRQFSYFCDKCFKSFNYVDGVKVGEFEAYEHIDRVSL